VAHAGGSGAEVAEVVTGEAVVLEVPCARFPSRLLALIIDLAIQVTLLIILVLITGFAAAGGGLDPASSGALVITSLVMAVVGYPVIWETLTRGRSPGKFALGLRVVSDDGGPERFRQALVRGLAAMVEIWALAGCPALICSLLSARGKRLGDLFGGTFVIQQRVPVRRRTAPAPAIQPGFGAWAAGLELSGLAGDTAETARRYLARMPELTPAARAELGERIAATVSAQVSPPPPAWLPAPDYLAAVLAELRRREQARLAAAAAWPDRPQAGLSASAASASASAPRPVAMAAPWPGRNIPEEAAHPPAGQPAEGHPTAGHPAAGEPETGRPETGQPETGQPETGQPEAGQPEAGQEEHAQLQQRPLRHAGGFQPPA
jgi:uncharacterized RDD family membrane protein YckC